MQPQPGQSIEIRFNNGVFFDATVQEWSDQKSVLILPTGETVIIQKTLQDVLLVKIHKEKEPENTIEELQTEIDKLTYAVPAAPNLQKLAELQDQLNHKQRQQTFGKMQEFKGEAKETNYGIPGYIPIKRSAQHPEQKATPTNPTFNSELQKLFNKKH